MIRRKAHRGDLKRKRPHHVAPRAEKVRDPMNRGVIFLCSRCPIGDAAQYSLRGDDGDFVVFCFATPEDAEAFAKRFGRELFRC
jgi:hypothetical protein